MFVNRRDDPSSMGPPPPLTPEQFAALPHDDAGPRINAVVWSLTAVSGLFLALRLFCKATRSKGFWWDDWVLTAAWVRLLFPPPRKTDFSLTHVIASNPGQLGPGIPLHFPRCRKTYLGLSS